jgi:glycosyltransferase involved in cell wall biosynthesis
VRIGLDARFLLWPPRGIARYSRNLLLGLSELDRDNDYLLYTNGEDEAGALSFGANFRVRRLRPSLYPLWEQVALPLALRRDRVTVFHALGNTGPILLPEGVRYVLNLYDVSYYDRRVRGYASLYQRLGRWYRRLVVPGAARRSDVMVTLSGFSRREIARLMPGARDKLQVVPPAVDDLLEALPREGDLTARCAEIRERLGIRGRYALHLGGTAPVKNTHGVLQAFACALQDRALEDAQLVICGLGGASDTWVHRQLAEAGLTAQVVIAPPLGNEQLACLYRGAAVVICLSAHEGFGLPLLEAMSFGVPCIAAASAALPEVGGEAVLQVPPGDVESAARALRQVLEEPALAEEMRNKGRERAKEYSRTRAASSVLRIYRQLERGERPQPVDDTPA